MYEPPKPMDVFMHALEERAKELNCLYKIEELLNRTDLSLDDIYYNIIDVLPSGMQYPDYCHARLRTDSMIYQPGDFKETPWSMSAIIRVQDEPAGGIDIYYTDKMPVADEGPFLKEERKLVNTIADRIGHFILHQKLKTVFQDWQSKKTELAEKPKPEWNVMLELLRKTDQHLFSIISRKMINHLFCKGIHESQELFQRLGTTSDDEDDTQTEVNRPSKKQVLENSFNLGMEIFGLAVNHLSDEEILSLMQKWVNEEKSHFLVKALSNQGTPLAEISDAITRYYHINPAATDRDSASIKGIKAALIRRFLTDQLEYIEIAKEYCDISDFNELLQRTIFPTDSHGKLGGKSAGLFLARKIIEKCSEQYPILASVRAPKTWYITSDALMSFIYYNNMEDVIEHKYKEIEEIRSEYHHLIQAFKNSHFPAEITNGLSRALDDFGDKPIIVRSSSLLEDRMGSSFAGKYKSLFLANQGSKQEKMEALMDAIAEVYASTFGPDPIGYRIERGLLDFNEEMGIMIQEVVGDKYGNYFFPAFAGVAFSNNEFRWSPRIKREDGLIRMVPGLGTRAVDRIGDDFPVLVAPGQPSLRVNLTMEEIIGYSPKNMDVINLETNSFGTMAVRQLVNDIGNDFPTINNIFSIKDQHYLKKPIGLGIDTKKHEIVVTFENLITSTNFISQIHAIIKVLKEELQTPVDIEFASNGRDIYILQCRPQSSTKQNASALIPRDIAKDKTIFTAKRYVSNGYVPDINYIVYVDPEKYSEHANLADLKAVGAAVGKLNKLLPKKNFILMGPGRWGSRGDIRLGVSVIYSDINNTSVLIEIAAKKENCVPDLSFGTHFFQDLVEASIRYLPLYPDEEGIIFNHEFFKNSENILTRFVPEYSHLADTIKVINVSETTKGSILRLLMNADEDEAIAFLASPFSKAIYDSSSLKSDAIYYGPAQWRRQIAESMALNIDASRFGVRSVYVFGSGSGEMAASNSDIDILVYYDGDPQKKRDLSLWFEGWNQCLNEINYMQSGYRLSKMLDVNFVTDEDLKINRYFADIVENKNVNALKLKLREGEE